ncbi:hypothetical protein C9374_014439 [Naegleria lovaniensis]|uniref:Uncharacterized protein n=1 Tax=Naegleria lovaniensis TaxID=51637 RepID=A0AA88GZY8_NAELO|nr:uncharacterized protein C9374_014439 [Naegleria lovaniensis]KAG2389039.1 hypothetical protein C9374_014439 [Naegleria lovaniensis]
MKTNDHHSPTTIVQLIDLHSVDYHHDDDLDHSIFITSLFHKLCKRMRKKQRKIFQGNFTLVHTIEQDHAMTPYVLRISYLYNCIMVGNAGDRNYLSLFDLNTKQHLRNVVLPQLPYYLCVEESNIDHQLVSKNTKHYSNLIIMFEGMMRKYKLRDLMFSSKDNNEVLKNVENQQQQLMATHKDGEESTSPPSAAHLWQIDNMENASSVTIKYSHCPSENIIYTCWKEEIWMIRSENGEKLKALQILNYPTTNIHCLEYTSRGDIIMCDDNTCYKLREQADGNWESVLCFGENSSLMNVVEVIYEDKSGHSIVCSHSKSNGKIVIFHENGEVFKEYSCDTISCCVNERNGQLIVASHYDHKICFYC